MPGKPKRNRPKVQSLNEFLTSYDAESLKGAMREVQNSLAWGLFRSFMATQQRMFEVAALDLIRHENQTHTAAHASGYAQALEDSVNKFIPDLLEKLSGNTGIVENPMPEEAL